MPKYFHTKILIWMQEVARIPRIIKSKDASCTRIIRPSKMTET